MKIEQADFLKSCRKISELPEYQHPEFAFLGRSNVGKSSLINMILGRKKLVKTGGKPGVTIALNFFLINEKLSFVDLPGYGYAKLPLELKKSFWPLIERYISQRSNLKLAFLLIDIRRKPGEEEKKIINLLAQQKIPTAITLTKCDKISKMQIQKNSQAIQEILSIDQEAIFYTSALKKQGRKELLKLVSDYQK